MLALTLGSMALGAAASAFGGAKAAKANERANKLLAQQQRDNQAWYDRRYHEDYTETAEAQNVIRMAKEAAEKQYRRAEGAAAVAGATDESVAQAKEAGNELVAETLANVAAQGNARKESVDNQYQQTKAALTNQQMAAEQAKAQAISNAAGQASNAFGNVASGLLQTGEGTEYFKKLWNNGI